MRGKILTAALIAAASAVPAHAAPERAVFQISGIVPTICRVSFNQPVISMGGDMVELGTFEQLCNDRDGYRVVLQHPANMQGAQIDIDGVLVPLSAGTETTVIDSNVPNYRMSHARLQLASSQSEMTTLSFRVEPKGMIF